MKQDGWKIKDTELLTRKGNRHIRSGTGQRRKETRIKNSNEIG